MQATIILQRLSPKILGNVEKNPYVYNSFEEVTNFLAESVTISLELIAARIKNVKATNRDSPVQYSTFVANDQVERSIVILPSMLTLINSPLLLDNLCKALLALGISQVLQHLQSMMTKSGTIYVKLSFC